MELKKGGTTIKNFGKGLLFTIIGLISIIIFLIIALIFLAYKDTIEYQINSNNTVKLVSILFGKGNEFELRESGLTDIYKSKSLEKIELFPRSKNSFHYFGFGIGILAHEPDDKAIYIQRYEKNNSSGTLLNDDFNDGNLVSDDNLYYMFSLIKQNSDGGDFLTNPDNYKINRIEFYNNYYDKYAQKSGNLLVWQNGAYYSGEYDENLIRDGFGEMHYFGKNASDSLKINDKLTLKLDESYSLNTPYKIYIGGFEAGNYTGAGELQSYFNGGYSLIIDKRNSFDGEPIGGYDTYRYSKINKKGGDFNESPDSYVLYKERHIHADGSAELIEKDFNGVEFKTVYEKDSELPTRHYNGYTLFEYTGGIKFYTDKIDVIKPIISGDNLIYENIPGVNYTATYNGDYKEIDGNIIRDGYGKLHIDYGNIDNYSIKSGLRENNNLKYGVDISKFNDYYTIMTGEFSDNSFTGMSLKTERGYYSGTEKISGGIFINSGFYRMKDGIYYSGGFSNMDEGGYDGYGEFRYYIPIKTGGNFIENEENYEMVYELTGYWNKGDYIGKIKPIGLFD